MNSPTIGRIVLYRTDGRNGLVYDLPAIVNCTRATHPGDYPDGKQNPLPVPESAEHVHLTVFSPGGFGTIVHRPDEDEDIVPTPHMGDSEAFVGADSFKPGSGTYVELNVPYSQMGEHRSWRWMTIP